MQDQSRNLLIGLFVTASIALGVWVLFFLNPSVGDAKQGLRVRFTNIDKVHLGTHVTYAGKHVGEVVGIRPVSRDESCALPKPGEACSPPVYVYELTLQMDSNIEVYNSDRIMVVTSGILGEKSVAIIPQCCSGPEEPKKLTYDDVIVAEPASGGVEEAIGGFSSLADRADKTLSDISGLIGRINDMWPKVEASVDDLAASLANTRELTADGKVTVNTMRELLDQIQNGEGTIGKLVSDPRLHLQISSIISKAEVLMDDVNHYGVLFHLDRSWQRQRTRRMNQMAEVDTSAKFRRFFEEEMSQMDTSLARVYQLIEMNEESDGRLARDRDFASSFQDLTRRVDGFKERLDAFNKLIHNPEVAGY